MSKIEFVKSNSGRGKQLWLDQARAIAIISMVLCHTNDILGCNYSV